MTDVGASRCQLKKGMGTATQENWNSQSIGQLLDLCKPAVQNIGFITLNTIRLNIQNICCTREKEKEREREKGQTPNVGV